MNVLSYARQSAQYHNFLEFCSVNTFTNFFFFILQILHRISNLFECDVYVRLWCWFAYVMWRHSSMHSSEQTETARQTVWKTNKILVGLHMFEKYAREYKRTRTQKRVSFLTLLSHRQRHPAYLSPLNSKWCFVVYRIIIIFLLLLVHNHRSVFTQSKFRCAAICFLFAASFSLLKFKPKTHTHVSAHKQLWFFSRAEIASVMRMSNYKVMDLTAMMMNFTIASKFHVFTNFEFCFWDFPFK